MSFVYYKVIRSVLKGRLIFLNSSMSKISSQTSTVFHFISINNLHIPFAMQPVRPLLKAQDMFEDGVFFQWVCHSIDQKRSVAHKWSQEQRWCQRQSLHSSLESGLMETWSFIFSQESPLGAVVRAFTTRASWVGKAGCRLINHF